MLLRVFSESREKFSMYSEEFLSRLRQVCREATATTDALKGKRSLSRQDMNAVIVASYSIKCISSSAQAPMIRLMKVWGDGYEMFIPKTVKHS